MDASAWLSGLAAVLKQLGEGAERVAEAMAPAAPTSGVQSLLDQLKVGEGKPFPAEQEILPGNSGFWFGSTLLGSAYVSKAVDPSTGNEVWVEEIVILGAQLSTFVSLTGSGTVAMKFSGAYDSTFSGPEAHVAAENAAGRTAYRCTWSSRHYDPPSASTVNTVVPAGTVILGKAYTLKDDQGHPTGALFRSTSTASNGEVLGSDAWLLRSSYQPPQGGTTPKAVTIAFDSATDLRSFLLAQIGQTGPALEYYSSSSYRIRKCAP